MKWSSFWGTIVVLIAALGLLSGCLDDIRYKGPCQVPPTIEESDLTGKWTIEYSNYWSTDFYGTTPITGIDTLTLQADGTYKQMFRSEDYNYDSPINDWELISESGEGSKLVMYNLRYFAYGLEHIDGPLGLDPQMPDALRYQKFRTETGIKNDIAVDYPDDEYVFLYPRRCLGKLVLLQMTSGGDPDELAVHNPAFTKTK